jgi:putative ABC transport system substrate-binding protein
VALIEDQSNPAYAVNEIQAAARALDVEVVPIYIRSVDDLDAALNAAVASRADALINLAAFVTGTLTNGPRIAEFALQRGWPSVGLPVDVGGLLNYNGVLIDPWKRAGVFVDRILKGASPAAMPVEGPTSATLAINMCTASKLGLNVPPSILSAATTLIPCAPR